MTLIAIRAFLIAARWWLLAASIAAACAGAVHVLRDQGRAEVQQKWDKAEAIRKVVADKAIADNRAEEARRLTAQKDIDDEAHRMEARNRAAALAVDAAAPSLRHAFAVSGGGGLTLHPEVVGLGPATAAAGVVQADVFGQIEQRLRDLGRYADESRTAGNACVGEYDALMR